MSTPSWMPLAALFVGLLIGVLFMALLQINRDPLKPAPTRECRPSFAATLLMFIGLLALAGASFKAGESARAGTVELVQEARR